MHFEQFKKIVLKNRYYFLIILFVVFSMSFFVRKKKHEVKEETSYKEKSEDKEKKTFVRTFKMKRVLFEDTIDGLIGTVRGASFEIKSSQEERVVKYHYKMGDFVKRNALIAELDHTKTGAKLHQAEIAYDRILRLYNVGGATHLQLAEAKESVVIAKKDYEDAFLRAPENGHVGEILVEEGELASRQGPIFTFVSSEKVFRIETNIIERKMSLIKRGSNVKIQIEAIPDEEITGKVLTVSPEATTASRMVPIFVSIPWEYMKRVKPGLSARLSISIYKNNSFVVPKSAIIEGKSAVYVASKGKAELREIQVGYQSRDYAEVLEGLGEEDIVILEQKRAGVKVDDAVVSSTPIEYEEV